MEIWKDVIGYENKYLVSNLGRLKSLPKNGRKHEIIIKPLLQKNGYYAVDLCKDSKVKKYTLHRLIALAFIENKENKPQVNHINGIKTDNRVENLEWNTRSENQLHSIRIGLRTTVGEKNSQAKLNKEQVLEIFHSKEMYKFIALKYNISISAISDIKRGYSWTHITGMKNIKKSVGKSLIY